eukprot:1897916-Prymnesium_polylepis.1
MYRTAARTRCAAAQPTTSRSHILRVNSLAPTFRARCSQLQEACPVQTLQVAAQRSQGRVSRAGRGGGFLVPAMTLPHRATRDGSIDTGTITMVSRQHPERSCPFVAMSQGNGLGRRTWR